MALEMNQIVTLKTLITFVKPKPPLIVKPYLTKNSILYSRANHIEVKHHFTRDYVEKGECILEFVTSSNKLADIFTKPLLKKLLFRII